jgi:hypothetical protein
MQGHTFLWYRWDYVTNNKKACPCMMMCLLHTLYLPLVLVT